jgi:polyisoprenyl-phosphate glycosyltransferase
MTKKLVSLIIPVYNNSMTIETLFKIINDRIIAKRPMFIFEVIFINDGSKDNSLEVLRKLANLNQNIIVLNLSKNYGQQYAILAGWKSAKGDLVIDFSADLQDPPEQCLNMIEEWEKGNKIVVSYRLKNNTSSSRRITSRLFYRLILPNAPKGGFDFTLLDRQPLNELISFKDKNKFYQADILSLGFSFCAIPYVKQKRLIGKSQYSAWSRITLFLAGYLNVSYAPIKFFSILGLIVTLIGFLYGITVLIAYFANGYPFKGWTPIMLVILLLGGLILTSLGVIGQYIWRILDEVRGRPNYIIESIIRGEKSEQSDITPPK